MGGVDGDGVGRVYSTEALGGEEEGPWVQGTWLGTMVELEVPLEEVTVKALQVLHLGVLLVV